jgi:hypothetical protein
MKLSAGDAMKQKIEYRIEPMPDNPVIDDLAVFGRTTGLFQLIRITDSGEVVVKKDAPYEELKQLEFTLLNK